MANLYCNYCVIQRSDVRKRRMVHITGRETNMTLCDNCAHNYGKRGYSEQPKEGTPLPHRPEDKK